MSDWIDKLFEVVDDENEQKLERMRDILLRKLDECRFQDNVHDDYVDRILSSDLDRADFNEMSTTFDMNALDVRYQYAPSQRQINKWLHLFCDL